MFLWVIPYEANVINSYSSITLWNGIMRRQWGRCERNLEHIEKKNGKVSKRVCPLLLTLLRKVIIHKFTGNIVLKCQTPVFIGHYSDWIYDDNGKMPLETAETRNYGPETASKNQQQSSVSPKIYKLDKASDELTPLNMWKLFKCPSTCT